MPTKPKTVARRSSCDRSQSYSERAEVSLKIRSKITVTYCQGSCSPFASDRGRVAGPLDLFTPHGKVVRSVFAGSRVGPCD